MVRSLVLALVLLPFVELYLLWRIGHAAGWEVVFALVLVPAMVGSWLARREGTRVLRQWQAALARRQVPEEGLLGGLLVLVGGVLLVLPGVVSDVLGLVLLLPPTRRLVARWVRREVERRIATGSMRVVSFSTTRVPEEREAPPAEPPRSRLGRGGEGEVDAEFTEADKPS
jgi:UPF0716 protein FxsA